MRVFNISRGDTEPVLRYRLTFNGQPVTIEEGSVARFSMAQGEGAPVIYRASAVFVSYSPAELEYHWQQGDTDRAGRFDGQFEVTSPAGRQSSYPNRDEDLFAVVIANGAGWRPTPPTDVVTYTQGDATTAPLLLTDDQGQPLDLTDATVTINVRVGAAWVQQQATVHDPLIGEVWPDWAAMSLAPRVYPMTITTTWPDGPATDPRHYVLNVQER